MATVKSQNKIVQTFVISIAIFGRQKGSKIFEALDGVGPRTGKKTANCSWLPGVRLGAKPSCEEGANYATWLTKNIIQNQIAASILELNARTKWKVFSKVNVIELKIKFDKKNEE